MRSAKCTGSFVNPITDICWSCLFPISVGGLEIWPSNRPDPDNPDLPVCLCGLRPGIAMGFWEPVRLADVSMKPWCFVNLGGMKLDPGFDIGFRSISGPSAIGGASQYYSSWHVHWYAYAGKIAAALDRQHPRDLFDIHYLLAQEGIGDDLFRAFLVYLVSHPRPAHELLQPHLLDIAAQYDEQFAGMTVEAIELDVLLDARRRLIEEIGTRVRTGDVRDFLLRFHALEPDFAAIGLPAELAKLPAVRWKLINLERLRRENKPKSDQQMRDLADCLAPLEPPRA